MIATKRLLRVNFTLYTQFINIFCNLQALVRPLNHERIKIVNRQYNFFKYERDSTHSRGLPHIDDIIDPPTSEEELEDSSEMEIDYINDKKVEHEEERRLLESH